MLNLRSPNNGDLLQPDWPHHGDDLDSSSSSSSSTPFVSAPSSPGPGSPSAGAVIPGGCFFSAPASPMHYVLTSSPSATCPPEEQQRVVASSLFEFEFEFSSRFSESGDIAVGSMSSADELFLNGQIRPMKLLYHLERPQILDPLLDTEGGDDGESAERGRDLKLRSRSLHRKARSLSPLRSAAFQWPEENHAVGVQTETLPENEETAPDSETTASSLASSSSRSSSSGKNSKKWIFLKEFLHRSKSEGRENGKEKFWSSMVFSPSKDKKLWAIHTNNASGNDKQKKPKPREKEKEPKQPSKSPAGRRRVGVSAHELHYTAKRAQAEEMKKRTYLPYRQGLFGCLGFSSKGYGALNGLAKTLSPVSSS